MLDNVDVAVLTKVNELAERHGLKSYDFVATFQPGEKGYALDFECPASGNDLREERFDKMLAAIGITVSDRATLGGNPAQIIDALDKALEHAPRTRLRF
jgi:hypothetical protein